MFGNILKHNSPLIKYHNQKVSKVTARNVKVNVIHLEDLLDGVDC